MSRILHILSQIPSQTGSGVFFDNISAQARLLGYEQAAVIGLPLSFKDYPIEGFSNSEVYKILFDSDVLPFKIPGMSDVMPYESTRFSDMSLTEIEAYKQQFRLTLRSAIETFKPDFILSNHLWVATAVAGELLSEISAESSCILDPARKRPRLYGICHGTDLRQMQLSPQIKPYVLKGCKHVDGVFALHQAQLEEIQRRYDLPKEKLHLIGNGYNPAIFHLENHEKFHRNAKIELIYVGKLAYSKGVMALIEAVSALDAQQYRLTLVGKGSGAEAESILEAISHTNADIRYLGYLTQIELAEVFKDSDIFMLPSFYEGLPLVVIEALASGLKVVVNDLPGLREWLGRDINDSGHIFYVPMPELEGLDLCKKTAEAPYIKTLSAAILNCANLIYANPHAICRHYSVIEERSWEKVFEKMETVFLSCGSKAL